MRTYLSFAATMIATSCAYGGFSGPYAPANWTFSSNGGNGAAVNSGTLLTLVGSDNGSGLPANTDYTITAAASGTWSFFWSFSSVDTGTFDSGGYLLNGEYTVLAYTTGGSGNVSLPINAGDVIGFRAYTPLTTCSGLAY